MPEHSLTTVWLTRGIAEAMQEEASENFPFESGGILMGYWAKPGEVAVVTCLIGPGPNAERSRYGFIPDHMWQRQKVAEHYARSGRLETYLGDWHCHPGAERAGLSRKDRKTLYRIAAEPEARAPDAIMIVLIGGPDAWNITGWIGRITRRRLFSRLLLTPIRPKLEV